MLKTSVIVLAVVYVLTAWSIAWGQEINDNLLRKLKAATVYLNSEKLPGLSQGTGFFIDQNLILTHSKMMPGSEDFDNETITAVIHSGLADEKELEAELVAIDRVGDLAFFRIHPKFGFKTKDFLQFGDSASLRETQTVYLSGFPFGNSLTDSRNPVTTIAPASISSFRKNKLGFIEAIQIDGNLVPGNSGGPVVNSEGKVVGVAQSMILATQIGFAVPSENVKIDIAGRIVQASLKNALRHDKNYSFQLAVTLCDPYRNIRAVEAHVWLGKANAKRPLDSQFKFPIYGAPGDSPKRVISLSLDSTNKMGQHWIGAVSDFEFHPNDEIWVQTISVDKSGQRRPTSSINNTVSLLNANRAPTSKQPNAKPELSNPSVKNDAAKQPFKLDLGEIKPPTLTESVSPQSTPKFEQVTTDKDGVVNISVKAESHSLGEISQFAVSPSGDAVYFVFEESSVIEKYNPADLSQPVKRLEVPKGAETIWCDSKRVVVGCRNDEHGKVLFIDPDLNGVLHQVSIPNLVPHMIVGRGPDDSIVSVWRERGTRVEHSTKVSGYLIDPQGPPRFLGKMALDWCTFCIRNEKLLFQRFGQGSPTGAVNVFDIASQRELQLNHLPNAPGWKLHDNFAPAFTTFDGKNIALSKSDSGNTLTALVTTDLRRIDMIFPGTVFAEDPIRGYLVAMNSFRDKNGERSPEVLYVNRQSGKVERRVLTQGLELHPAFLTLTKTPGKFAYVPGHELVIFTYANTPRDARKLHVIRCGPLSGESSGAEVAKIDKLPPDAKPSSPNSLEPTASLYDQLANRFSRPEPTVSIRPTAVPDPAYTLDARREHDSSGLPITVANATPERFSLGDGKLLQVVADPTGEKLYAIFEDQSYVKIIDSQTMKAIGEIQVPRNPVALGFKAATLVVACSESRTFAFIDTAKDALFASVRLSNNKDLVPAYVSSVAPDGSVVSLWKKPGSLKETYVYLISPNSEPLLVLKTDLQAGIPPEIEWAMFPNAQNSIWTQRSFGGSPSGPLNLFKVSTIAEVVPTSHNAFGRKGFTTHNTYGLAFLSSDRSRVIAPVSMYNYIKESYRLPTRTLIISPDLTRILSEIPGAVITELDSEDSYVAWRSTGTKWEEKSIDILYISRSSGRVHRLIKVPKLDTRYESPSTSPRPEIVYVPGRELLLLHDSTAKNSVISVVRCGPVPPNAFVPADPAVKSDQAPPTIVYVGRPVKFNPDFRPVRTEGPLTYRVKRGIPGVKVDATTGTIEIDPSAAYIGSFDIEIEAEADGHVHKVLSWVLDVDLPPEP